jgi:O-antigen ligase
MTPPRRDVLNPHEDGRLGPLAAALVAAVIGAAFFVIDHDLQTSIHLSDATTVEEAGGRIEAGSVLRPAAFLSVGAMGLVLACRRGGRRPALADPLTLSVLLLAAWSALSIAWSDDRFLTAKRVVELGCGFAAALGLARHASLRDLHRVAIVILLVYAGIGLAAEAALGTLQPWSADYRFAGTVHPNAQGLDLAVLILAIASLLGAGRDNRPWIALAAVAAALLLLTRSRSAVFGLAAALGGLGWLKMSGKAWALGAVAAAGLGATVTLAWAAGALAPAAPLVNALLLGRTDDADTLSGRVPLWTELLGYVRQRPWTGYGYDSFLTPQRIEAVSDSCQWTIESAHSTYLEVLLGLGLIGTALLAVSVALSFHRLAACWRASGEDAYAFLLGLLVLWLAKGVLESGFVDLMFISVVAACSVSQVPAIRLGARAAGVGDSRRDPPEDGPLPAAGPPLLPHGFMAVPAE